jgi:hypothetical protein
MMPVTALQYSQILANPRRDRVRSGMREFESSNPSQSVRNSEKMSLLSAEKPANGGLLRIRHQSPGSGLRHFLTKIAGSLRRTFAKFPFLGDGGRRLGSICTAWPSWRCLRARAGRCIRSPVSSCADVAAYGFKADFAYSPKGLKLAADISCRSSLVSRF